MQTTVKHLIIIFITIVIIKVMLSSLVPAPSAFSDEYMYAKAAKSILHSLEFSVHGTPLQKYPPLYPIFLSIAYLFRDMELVYLIMKIINSILSTAIIFPAYFLAREFVKEKEALTIIILISLLPSSFAFSPYIMAENLFYPLFLTSIYFIYKAFTQKSWKWDILAGLFIGLSYLTKVAGFSLIGIIAVILLYKLYKKETVQKNILIFIVAAVIVAPWLLRNISLFGFTLNGMLGSGYAAEFTKGKTIFSIPAFVNWIILYIGFLTLSTGGLFAISLFSKQKNKHHKLLLFLILASILTTIIAAANHNSLNTADQKGILGVGRPLGRYVDVVAPLMIMGGYLGLRKECPKYLVIAFSLVLIISLQLTYYPLFPVNNLSLAHVGLIKYAIDYIFYGSKSFVPEFTIVSTIFFIITFGSIPFIVCWLKRKLNLKLILYSLLIIFVSTSIINYAVTYYNSKTVWYNSEQMQLGLWFNSYDQGKSNILIDERDYGVIEKGKSAGIYEKDKLNGPPATVIGFFMNNEITVGDVEGTKNYNYIISKHDLNLPLIKSTEDGIKVYKVQPKDD